MDDDFERMFPGPRPAASTHLRYLPVTLTRPPKSGGRQSLPVLKTELPRLFDGGDLDHRLGGDGGGSLSQKGG